MADLSRTPSMVTHIVRYTPRASPSPAASPAARTATASPSPRTATASPRTATKDAETNTANNNIGFINMKKKKKSHNITIKNFNPNEPTIRETKIQYSDKQKYRKYKTDIEPKLQEKIKVDEEDDLIDKIRKEFGINIKNNKQKNYSEPITAEANYTRDPEQAQEPETKFQENSYYRELQEFYENEISEMGTDEIEDLTGQILLHKYNHFKNELENDDDDDYEVWHTPARKGRKPKKPESIERRRREDEELRRQATGRIRPQAIEEEPKGNYDFKNKSFFQNSLKQTKNIIKDTNAKKAGVYIRELSKSNKDKEPFNRYSHSMVYPKHFNIIEN